MSSRDIWSEDLENLLNYNPPAVEQIGAPAIYRLPFLFFDPHIDPRLALKRVVLVPSFTADIARVVDREIQIHKDAGQPPPPADFEYEETEDACMMPTGEWIGWMGPQNIVTDASSVARFYRHVSYCNCSAVGSTLGLHPRSHTWLTVFRFSITGAEPDEGHSAVTNQYYLYIREDKGTRNISVPRGVWKCLGEDARADLTEIHSRFRRLVTYQFYAASKEYDGVLERMGDVAAQSAVTPLSSRVSGFPKRDSSLPPIVDSAVLPWTCFQHKQTSHRDIEPTPLSGEDSLQNETGNVSSSVSGEPDHLKRVLVAEATVKLDDVDIFVRHAWTRSVMEDTTFIIFHCGKYERIGVRHRATGTLFLSNLIDLHSCRDPAYGKIESGLYLLVIRDAMERAHQFRTSHYPPSIQTGIMGKQHTKSSDSLRTKKRPKTRSVTASVEKATSLILDECDKRDLALLHVQHGPFNSPSPVPFLRSGSAILPGTPCRNKREHKVGLQKRGYQNHEYFEILLTPDFDSGATGQVHKSVIRITLRDGKVLSHPVVVKVAFHDFQKERLRHEYVVYKYMASQRVKSVPSIFGLFEHVEDESSMMVMSDAGISLYNRELARNPGKIAVEQISVSREERDAFKQALSEVHSAGIRHYDIRPMNLMIDDEGKVTIIDFDMAKMGAGEHSRKSEFDDLCLLLQGRYIPPNQFASSPTTQSSRPDSDFLRDL